MLVTGLNEPQEPKGVHDQVTPELLESLATRAVRLAVAPGLSDEGGGGFSKTEIPLDAVMMMVAEANAELLCIAIAVIVTKPPPGIAAGAV